MLGSADAEDAVQEAFLRWSRTDQTAVRVPGAWLTTTLSRIALDRLKSAQRERETYVGSWLPEPVATTADPADIAFVLHDVFGHPHTEVAAMLDRSPAAVRQLARRARQRLAEGDARYDADRSRQQAVVRAFVAACDGGDVDGMLEVLTPGVALTGDGGGVATTAPEPLPGADRVAHFWLALWRTGVRRGLAAELAEVNTARTRRPGRRQA